MRSKSELRNYAKKVKKAGGSKGGRGSKSINMDSGPKKCVKTKFGAKSGKSLKKVIAKILGTKNGPKISFLAKSVIVKKNLLLGNFHPEVSTVTVPLRICPTDVRKNPKNFL
jgi:hypothetical protein